MGKKLRKGTRVMAWFNGDIRPGVIIDTSIRLAYVVRFDSPVKVSWSDVLQEEGTCSARNVFKIIPFSRRGILWYVVNSKNT